MRIEARVSRVAMQAIWFGVKASELPPERQKSAVLYLLVTCGNVPGALAAEVAGCTKQNVSKLLRKVEDRRDDPHFDALLDSFEQAFFGKEGL